MLPFFQVLRVPRQNQEQTCRCGANNGTGCPGAEGISRGGSTDGELDTVLSGQVLHVEDKHSNVDQPAQ